MHTRLPVFDNFVMLDVCCEHVCATDMRNSTFHKYLAVDILETVQNAVTVEDV